MEEVVQGNLKYLEDDLHDDERDDDELELGGVGVVQLRLEHVQELPQNVEALVEDVDAVGQVQVLAEGPVPVLLWFDGDMVRIWVVGRWINHHPTI